LQARVGTPFDPSALAAAMALSNEQAEWNRRTRDAIAAAPRSPAAIDELIPAVMLPQWHRGTEWGRDAARDLCEEITTRVDGGYARCPEERARLMLIGRGLWGDMGFYRQFEESHGAVFVWSMYLGVAADGYTRRGPDPVRALAARFAAFHDQLYTPPWSSSWYLKEALAHRVDGAVHFVSADSRNSWATTAALEEAGIPVFEIHTDNVDTRTLTPELVREDMRRWLEGPVTEQRRVR
jgi:benzoyl-CoA reductase/2-hydroxyglutaryl-CoA dehydratase subunit BcrC/BadD/HgdB